MRHTGIDVIGDVPWGTHFCQFYQHEQDLVDIVVPYFKAGLENNEFCMWVTSEPLHVEEARAALASQVKNLDTYIRDGQLEILDYSQWYTVGGSFEADRVLQGWVDRLDAASKRGFDGLRLSGNTFWLEKSHWNDFKDYEAAVDGVIGQYRMLALCTYSLARCGALEIIDVVSNHAFALIKQAGEWKVIQGAERKRQEASLRETEEKFRGIFNWMGAAMQFCELVVDADGRPVDNIILDVNPAYEKHSGLLREQVVGRSISEILPVVEQVWLDRYGEVVRTRQPMHFEEYNASLDRWFDVHASPVKGDRFAVIFSDITARKRMEQALRVSEERFRRIVESNMVGFAFWHEDGRLTEANQAFCDLIGYEPEDVRDGRVGWTDVTPPEILERDRQGIEEINATGVCTTYEKEFIHRDGHRVPVLIGGAMVGGVRDQGVALAIDITQRKRAEEALKQSEAQYRTLFENMAEDVHFWKVIRDEGGCIKTWRLVDANPPALRTWGKTLDEIKGKTAEEIFGPGPSDRLRPIVQKIMTEGVPHCYEDYLLDLDRHFRYTSVPLRDYFITTGTDITAHKRAENVLRRSNEELEQFAYVASHDLQEPLRTVTAYTQLLVKKLEEPPDAEVQACVDFITGGTSRMAALIQGLLEYSRAAAATAAIQSDRAAMDFAFKAACENLRASIEATNAVVTSDSLPQIPADPGQMTQLFQNLLSNSIKYRRPDVPLQVHVGAEYRDGEWVFRVEDNGQGFAPRDAQKVFRIFQRLHGRDVPGTGIGLAIVKAIVVRHGGRIWAEAEPGKGATFRFTLPGMRADSESI